MKAHPKDALCEFMGEYRRYPRNDNWLFGYLSQSGWKADHYNVDLRNQMLHELRRTNKRPADVIELRESRLIVATCFRWFEDTDRFFRFIVSWFPHKSNDFSAVLANPLNLGFVDRCILHVDLQQQECAEKAYELNRLRMLWGIQREKTRVISWANEGDKNVKRIFVYEALEKRLMAKREVVSTIPLSYNTPVPANFSMEKSSRAPYIPLPPLPPASFEDLLIYVDANQLSDAEIRLSVESARKRFGQVKYREKTKDKKQVNFVVSRGSVDRLEQISRMYGLSKTQVLEQLINAECVVSRESVDKLEQISRMHGLSKLQVVEQLINTEHDLGLIFKARGA